VPGQRGVGTEMSEYSDCYYLIVSDIAIFVLKRDVKLQLTNCYYLNGVLVVLPL